MTNILQGSVMQLDSPIGPAIFIVFGPEDDGIIDPRHGRRIFGLWASHFDKAHENTHGWIWENLLRSDAWVNIAATPTQTDE